jgi:hypothetical protein
MSEERNLQQWQEKLLPTMKAAIIVLGLFFLVATGYQLHRLQRGVDTVKPPNLTEALKTLGAEVDNENKVTKAPEDALKTGTLHALCLMEANVVERRYHHVNTALMHRLWIRYLGFLTGMILALIGAVFVLGKLQDQGSKLSAEGTFGSFQFWSTSPGLVLAVLGTILVSMTIAVRSEVTVTDASTYLPANDTPIQKLLKGLTRGELEAISTKVTPKDRPGLKNNLGGVMGGGGKDEKGTTVKK